MNAKFKVGQIVDFNPVRASVPASSREYKILKLLPLGSSGQQYRIKSIAEVFERIANEADLTKR